MTTRCCLIKYSIVAGYLITASPLILSATLFVIAKPPLNSSHRALAAFTSPAQEWDCRIFGRIVSGDGAAVAGVVVTLEGTRLSTVTGADGRYYFGKLRPGVYQIVFKPLKPGTRGRRLEVTLAGTSSQAFSGERRELNVTLPRSFERPTPVPSTRPTPVPSLTPVSTPGPVASPDPLPSPTASPTTFISASPRPSAALSPIVEQTPTASPVELSALDKKIAALPWGSFAFNVPESIRLDELKPIQLLLSPTKSAEELKAAIREEGKAESNRIHVSNEMEAVLAGSNDAFNITEVLPRRRAISRVADTEWKWDVRAVKPGKQRLHFIVNAYVMVDGIPEPYTVVIKEFDKEYEIDVPWKQRPVFAFVGNNWQWLWTAIFIPIAGGIWGFRRQKSKKKPRKRR